MPTRRTIHLYRSLRESKSGHLVTTLSRVRTPERVEIQSERFVSGPHGYLLPVLFGVCLFLGGLLLLGPGAIGEVSSLAFVALGGGVLTGSLAYFLRKGSGTLELLRSPNPIPVLSEVADCPRCAAAPASLEWEDLFFGRFEARARSEETAGPVRTLFTPTAAGEQLWVHWLPAGVGQLPVELIGPLAESAYYPTESDDLTAALVPEFTAISGCDLEESAVTGGARGALAPDSQARPPNPSGMDPIPPPRTPPFASLPVTGRAHSIPRPTEGTAGPETQTPKWMRSILAEALNPIPPHLRNDPAATRGPMMGLSSPLEVYGPTEGPRPK